MILHEPYGIDDPYKQAACERSPRDPLPGDPVQVRFKASHDAERAWAEVSDASGVRRVDAARLGDGIWSVDIGAFEPGKVEYTLHAEPPTVAKGDAERSAARFRFEVGSWVEVVGIERVEERGDRLRLWLKTSSASAARPDSSPTMSPAASRPSFVDLVCPLAGVLRTELTVGEEPQRETPHRCERLTHSREGGRLSVSGPGLHAELDLDTLKLTVHDREASSDGEETRFSGSLRFQWLAYADGQVGQVRTRFDSRPDEWLYGLGERFTGANRNGEIWDVRVYEEYKEQGKRTYLPVPFVVSLRGYGVWLDAAEPSVFDLRSNEPLISVEKYVERGNIKVRAAVGPLLSLCVIVGRRPYDVTAAFTRLTGAIAVPPKWAFGPWMSSNSWNSQATAEAAMRRTVAEGVPAGVIVIEAWSDESTFYIFNDAQYEPKAGDSPPRLGDFTFTGRWPDPAAFIDYCHEHGTRVVLWQIPVLKWLGEAHAQHDIDEQWMIDKGYAILNADGTPYRNKGWWFTNGLVIDFTNPDARDWWFSKRRYLFAELGIDGMKTDGGEHLWGRDLLAHDGRRGTELVNAYANLYVGAYHEFVQRATDNDGLTFSRAGFTGAQRFPGHWAGDEDSSWDAYRASIRAGLAAGASGISMWSWDIAGFSGEIPNVELYLRSTAMAVFSPLMQYHSEGHGASEVRDRTPWNIAERHGDQSALTLYREFARLRMNLVDLIFEDALDLSARGLPLMRYPALEYQEEHEFLAQDPHAYLFGRDLLVAPVVDKGVAAREVRLPPGRWLDGWSGSEFEGPRLLQANATIERIPVFVRADSDRRDRWLAAIAAAFPGEPG